MESIVLKQLRNELTDYVTLVEMFCSYADSLAPCHDGTQQQCREDQFFHKPVSKSSLTTAVAGCSKIFAAGANCSTEPRSITSMSSASFRASRRSCVTSTTVRGAVRCR